MQVLNQNLLLSTRPAPTGCLDHSAFGGRRVPRLGRGLVKGVQGDGCWS
jgi:hypothetical protein